MSQLAEPLSPARPGFIRHRHESEVSRLNTIVGTQREFALTWAGKVGRFRFVPPAPADPPTGWLRVRLDEHSFDWGLPALPELSSLGAGFAGIEIAQLPEKLLLGVLEVWLEEPIAALQRQGITVHLEGWRNTDSPPASDCGWELTWDSRERFLAGTVHADGEAMTHLANLVSRTKPSSGRSADSVPFAVSIALAHLPLSLVTLAALGPGDVVLLPLARGDWTKGACELWTGDRALGRALKQQQKVTLLTMNSSSEAPSVPAAPPARHIDELPVQVVFDVGMLELTVGQLRTLREGYTFELPATSDRAITIRANGREIGRGDLVEVGEKLGVRILHWTLQ